MTGPTFSARLFKILIDRDLTQTDLARMVYPQKPVMRDKNGNALVRGKDQISGYISGRREPSARVYYRILKALDVTEEQLPLARLEKPAQPRASEIERLRAERDHWREAARKLSEVVTALAVQLKEANK